VKIKNICWTCNGTGEVPHYGVPPGTDDCRDCDGQGFNTVDVIGDDFTELNTKIDAIKAMLDSAIYGMQKMSSNLDDIMVKLDV
jgi:DnaJ-class molecular chaperone